MQFIIWFSEHWRLGYRFRIVLMAAFLIVLVVLLYPFQSTTVPQWNLRVVDDAGAAVREINVTEHWQDYLLEADGHEEALRTNQDGWVSFGARNIRASILRTVFARISKFGSRDNPGRAVRYGAVVVWGQKEYETSVAVYQDFPPAEIRVRRLR